MQLTSFVLIEKIWHRKLFNYFGNSWLGALGIQWQKNDIFSHKSDLNKSWK